jgi:hypothetical protein
MYVSFQIGLFLALYVSAHPTHPLPDSMTRYSPIIPVDSPHSWNAARGDTNVQICQHLQSETGEGRLTPQLHTLAWQGRFTLFPSDHLALNLSNPLEWLSCQMFWQMSRL